MEISLFLLRRLLGVKTEDKKQTKVTKLVKNELLLINIGSTSTGGRVISVKADLAKIQLTSPACTEVGEKVALSRRIEKHWRLVGECLLYFCFLILVAPFHLVVVTTITRDPTSGALILNYFSSFRLLRSSRSRPTSISHLLPLLRSTIVLIQSLPHLGWGSVQRGTVLETD